MYSVTEQIMVLVGLSEGYFDSIAIKDVHNAIVQIVTVTGEFSDEFRLRIAANKELASADRSAMLQAIARVIKQYQDKQ